MEAAVAPNRRGSLFPLPAPETPGSLLNQRQLDRYALAFILLGLVARCVRYFLRFPLWEDESFLCCNILERDYRGLLKPLDYHQVAPLLFLWTQLTIVKIFGAGEMSLRIVSFLAGIGSLLLFWRLARRCLVGLPQVLAVALFSVTYAMIRYSAEAKPYGLDLFLSLVLVTFVVRWLGEPGRNRWLWVMAAVIPLGVGFSYGIVFLGGGLSVAVAWVIWRERRWSSVAPWAVYSVALAASFLVQYLLCIDAQSGSLEIMREMWQEHFPPLDNQGQFVYWMLHTHAGDIVAYPAGGSPFQSTLSGICWIAGLIALARRRQVSFLVLCLAPQALTFLAALLRRYPYGGHIRLNLYLAPFMCMVIAYGAAVFLAWSARCGWRAALGLRVFLLLLGLLCGVSILRDLATPYKNKSDLRARGFAQWFWYNANHEGEVVCLKTDLGIVFSPETYQELNFSAEYLCNQRIYSPRHAAGQPVCWEAISASHPLRCVLYRATGFPFDEDAFRAWLSAMQQEYALDGWEDYPLVRQSKEGPVTGVDHIQVIRFIPRTGPPPTSAAALKRAANDAHAQVR